MTNLACLALVALFLSPISIVLPTWNEALPTVPDFSLGDGKQTAHRFQLIVLNVSGRAFGTLPPQLLPHHPFPYLRTDASIPPRHTSMSRDPPSRATVVRRATKKRRPTSARWTCCATQQHRQPPSMRALATGSR